MVICVTPEDVTRKGKQRMDGRLVEMIGDRSAPWDGPIGHLVRQPPNVNNVAHFHDVDQYKIFVAGSARLGGHDVRLGSVHYNDAYSGYGPIVTAEDGLAYVTLRANFDTSYHPLPRDAALGRGRKGGQYLAHMDLRPDIPEGVTALFQRADGVAAYQANVGPGHSMPEIERLGGGLWLIMMGDVAIDGRPCPAGTCTWVGEGEIRPTMIAGNLGAVVAVMCFASALSQAARRER